MEQIISWLCTGVGAIFINQVNIVISYVLLQTRFLSTYEFYNLSKK